MAFRWSVLTVDVTRVVVDDLLDDTLLLQVGEGLPGERAVDLQAIDEDGDGDETVGLDILVELLRGLLVEDDGVVGLVLDCITQTMLAASLSSKYNDSRCRLRCE